MTFAEKARWDELAAHDNEKQTDHAHYLVDVAFSAAADDDDPRDPVSMTITYAEHEGETSNR